MKEKFEVFCKDNIIFTLALMLLLFALGIQVLFVGLKDVIALAEYPASDRTRVFRTSNRNCYFITYSENEYVLFAEDYQILYRSEDVVRIIPGEPVLFYMADGSVVEIDPEMSIEKEEEVTYVE